MALINNPNVYNTPQMASVEMNKRPCDTNTNPRGKYMTYSHNINRAVTPTEEAMNLPNYSGIVRGLYGILGKTGRNA